MNSPICRFLSIFIPGLLLCGSLWANSFTYQGRLDSGGQPHNGLVGMFFELFDAASGGDQIGPTVSHSVSVSDGLFQAELDFGEQPYRDGRWLQITVNGQVLSPRQRVTGAPFALREPDEPWRIVGEAGEPEFKDGIDGDCPWGNFPEGDDLLSEVNPTSFRKNSRGIVRLRGAPLIRPGPEVGDCDQLLDNVIFELPVGYQPENLEILSSPTALAIIIPAGGLMVDGTMVPGGSIVTFGLEVGFMFPTDGFTFQAASSETTDSIAREHRNLSLEALRHSHP